ncbi:MAG TPA: hypothetical protein VIU44_07925 [Gaiellaceae bacterium]
MKAPMLPRRVIEAGQRFHEGVQALCASYKGRKCNRQTEADFRRDVGALVQALYRDGGFLCDYRDNAPIWDPALAHLAVRFERGELTFSLTKRAGRPS